MSSAKELEQTLARMGSAQERTEFIAEHRAALTAAVRREDAAILEERQTYVAQHEKASLASAEFDKAIAHILSLITSEQQSSLDAYRDSVLSEACIRVANWFKAHRIAYASSLWEIESALKGSSDVK